MHLNLGAGTYLLDGHDNLDSQPYAGVTVVRRVPPLPYEDATVESIFAGHFVEHVPPHDLAPLFAECMRVLHPGGTLTVIVPDADIARHLMLHADLLPYHYALAVQGEVYDDMPHYTIWNQQRLAQALQDAGFTLRPDYRWQEDWRVADRRVPWQAGAQGVKP